jgi:hypothetical protein
MAYIHTIVSQIRTNESFIGDMDGKLGFIPNELEGIGELATYIENDNNIKIINDALAENDIVNTGGFRNVIYGSLGSSSSQIFVPRNINREELVGECYEAFHFFHPDMDLLVHDVNTMFESLNTSIDCEEWTIILVSRNTLFDKYVPFYVLYKLYEITGLTVTISNCIAHVLYKKNKTYQDLCPSSPKKTASLYELFRNETSILAVKSDLKSPAPFVDKFREVIFNFFLEEGVSIGFFLNTFVIPRTKAEGSYVDNSWDATIWFKSTMGGLAIDGYQSLVDIGGGRTNEGYETNNIQMMMTNILKEMKGKYGNQPCFPVCTGKIRTDIESMMFQYTFDKPIVRLQAFHIVPPYIKYFVNSKYRVPDTDDQLYLFVI